MVLTFACCKGVRAVFNDETLRLLGETPEAFQIGIVQGQCSKNTLILQAAAKGNEGALAPGKVSKEHSLNTTKFFKDRGLDKVVATEYTKPDYDAEHNAFIVSL